MSSAVHMLCPTNIGSYLDSPALDARFSFHLLSAAVTMLHACFLFYYYCLIKPEEKKLEIKIILLENRSCRSFCLIITFLACLIT